MTALSIADMVAIWFLIACLLAPTFGRLLGRVSRFYPHVSANDKEAGTTSPEVAPTSSTQRG